MSGSDDWDSNIDPSLMPPPVPVSPTPIVVDVIVKEFDLSEARRKDLQGLHQVFFFAFSFFLSFFLKGFNDIFF